MPVAVVDATDMDEYELQRYPGYIHCIEVRNPFAEQLYDAPFNTSESMRLCLVPVKSREEAEELRRKYFVPVIATLDVNSVAEAEEALRRLERIKLDWAILGDSQAGILMIASPFSKNGEPSSRVKALVELLRRRGIRVKTWTWEDDYFGKDPFHVLMGIAPYIDEDDAVLVVTDAHDSRLMLLLDSKQDLERAAKALKRIEEEAEWLRLRQRLIEELGQETVRAIDRLLAKHYRHLVEKIVYMTEPSSMPYELSKYKRYSINTFYEKNMAFTWAVADGKIWFVIGPLKYSERIPAKPFNEILPSLKLTDAIREYITGHPLFRSIVRVIEKKAKNVPRAVFLIPYDMVPPPLREKYMEKIVAIGGKYVIILTMDGLKTFTSMLPLDTRKTLTAVMLEGDNALPVKIHMVNIGWREPEIVIEKAEPHALTQAMEKAITA